MACEINFYCQSPVITGSYFCKAVQVVFFQRVIDGGKKTPPPSLFTTLCSCFTTLGKVQLPGKLPVLYFDSLCAFNCIKCVLQGRQAFWLAELLQLGSEGTEDSDLSSSFFLSFFFFFFFCHGTPCLLPASQLYQLQGLHSWEPHEQAYWPPPNLHPCH